MADYTFDLDGTLCTQPEPDSFGSAEPYPERIERVNALKRAGHRVLIDTARGSRTGIDWREFTVAQLASWGLEYDELRVGVKRGAEVMVDDRAVHPDSFFGDGPSLEDRRSRAATLPEFVVSYFEHLHAAAMQVPAEAVEALVREMEQSREEDATIFICANGGSAGSANHIANGLGFHLQNWTGRGFRFQSLCANNVALTAIPNDTDFSNVFVGQLEQYWRPGDRVMVMSCSGSSPNIVRAAEWARAKGARVIGMLGTDGGDTLPLCDVAIHVRTAPLEYGPIEDIHMALCHALVHWYQR